MPAWRPSGISRGLTAFAARLRRAAALAAVALLHVALVFVLLIYSNERTVRGLPAAREIVLRFEALPKPASPRRPAHSTVPLPGPARVLPDYRGITLPNTPVSPGLRQSLFGCAGAERSDLSPAERARCADAFAQDDSVDIRDGTKRSRSAALWERGRQRKNGPLLLPCMLPDSAPGVSLYTVYCLAKGVTEGFDPDNQPGYFDQPTIVHVPNGGDPPDGPPSSH